MYRFSLGLTFLWNTLLMILLTFVGVFIVVGDWYLLDEGLRETINTLNIDKDLSAIPFIFLIFYFFIQVKITIILSCIYERTSTFVGIITLLTNPILGILILVSQPISFNLRGRKFTSSLSNNLLCVFAGLVLTFVIAFLIPHIVFYLPEWNFRNNVSKFKKDMESYSTKEGFGNSNQRLENINKREVYNILEYGVYCGSGEKEQVEKDLKSFLSITPTPSRKINNIKVLDRNIKTKFSNYKDEVDVTKTCWKVNIGYKVLGNNLGV